MLYFYIIYSKQINKYYVGSTENIDLRIERHNLGTTRFTSQANDWVLAYYETFNSKSEAIKREYEIKRIKSRKYIESLIEKKCQE